MLQQAAMTGITAWQVDDSLEHLEAQIVGGEDTPYKGGIFKLSIRIPGRYPFEPPHVKFLTPIYHPNIDTSGRICLDVLKMPPKGEWKPSSNVRTVLLSIQLLMNEPNPDDPLMEEISNQFKTDRAKFTETAAIWTKKYAKDTGVGQGVGQERTLMSSTIVDSSSKSNTEKGRIPSGTNNEHQKPVTESSTSIIRSNTPPVPPISTSSVKANDKSNKSTKSESKSSTSTLSKPSTNYPKEDPFFDSSDEELELRVMQQQREQQQLQRHEKTPVKATSSKQPVKSTDDDGFDSDLDLFDFESPKCKKRRK